MVFGAEENGKGTGSGGISLQNVMIALVVLLLIVMFSEPLMHLIYTVKQRVSGALGLSDRLACGCRVGHCTCNTVVNMPEGNVEHLTKAGSSHDVSGGGAAELMALGYDNSVDAGSWSDIIKVSDLDPSVHVNHADWVADVRRFSSGANFTSVADDNNSFAFTNFVGLRRPQHVDIYQDARQIPDIDVDVLQRNKPFVF